MENKSKTPKIVYLIWIIGILAVSQSGSIVRLGDANPTAIATWRLVITAIILIPFVGSQLKLLLKLSRWELTLLVFSGIALAAHLITWITAVQLTTVANATIFFSINPVFTSIAAAIIFHERLTLKLFISILAGLLGAYIIGREDFSLNPNFLLGDGSALLCSVLFTIYFLIGKKLRQKLPNWVYVTGVYLVAGVVCFICLLYIGEPVFEYNNKTWLCFLLMALIPTIVGHTSLNNTLRYIDASRISVTTLSEPLLAGIGAYFFWGEKISYHVIIGYIFIAASVIILILDKLIEPKKRARTLLEQ